MRNFTTEDIDFILDKYSKGLTLTRKEKIFHRNIEYTLDSNINIILTKDELNEYSKCYNNSIYFIEKYCNITLREYQKEWIRNVNNNRFLIFCNSRQVGFSQIMSALYLYYMIFHSKSIFLICNKISTGVDFIEKLFNYYLRLPYFLKPVIIHKNIKNIKFNDCDIKLGFEIDDKYDIISYMEYSYIPTNKLNLNSVIPSICIEEDSKLIIQSQPNGNDEFYKLVYDSERKENDPNKNIFKTIKTYWWEVSDRDNNWKNDMIKMIGEESFNKEYDLKFVSK